MIDISLTALVERLDPTCRNALVGATGECVTQTHYEVAIEHVLVAMLEGPDEELGAITGAFETDWARLQRCLHRNLKTRARGNTGRPVFSPFLVEWLMDAWLIGSIEHGRESVGAGALWAALAARPDRYVDDAAAGLLQQGGLPGLRRRLDEFVQGASVAATSAGARNPSSAPAEDTLARFCVNFSAEARAGRIDPVFGRDAEIRQMVDILGRRRKNNPIVVGEPGVGKTALVEGLALKIANGGAPEFLRGVEIMGLDIGLLQAGASVKGEFEKRLKDVIAAVETMSRPVVLFFDEAHMLIGAGAAPGGADAANLLKPALARGEFRAIAATTWMEYKKYFEKDAALSRRFQLVKLDTPSTAEAVTMLRGLRERFERAHGLSIRDEAIEAAVQLSSRHISGGQLPDKAIDVLDTTAARVRVSRSSEPAEVERLSARIDALRREESGLARDHVAGGGNGLTPRLGEIGARVAELEGQRAVLVARWTEEKALAERIVACEASVRRERILEDPPAEDIRTIQDLSIEDEPTGRATQGSAAAEDEENAGLALAGDAPAPLGARASRPHRAPDPPISMRAGRPRSQACLAQARFDHEDGGPSKSLEAFTCEGDADAGPGDDDSASFGICAGEDLATLRARLAELQAQAPLVHFEVTADAVARTVSDWTGVPLGAMARGEAADALDFAAALSARVRGQERAVGLLDRELRISRAGLADPDKPRGVFLLVGPSGVGKTDTAFAIADTLFGGHRQLTVVNLSEYQEAHTVSRLFGAPPGYVGYGEGGVLTEAVRRRPYSIVLLDEAEKAHPEVLNAFYQVFDKGEMADGEGRRIDFRNTIIVLTSNLCAQTITQMTGGGEPPDTEAMVQALRPALARHFKPALLARMRVVPYVPLTAASLRKIVVQRLERVGARLKTQQGLELTLSDAVIGAAAAHCARGDGGARDIDALVNQTLLPRISTRILAAMNGEGALSGVAVGLSEQGDWTYEFS